MWRTHLKGKLWPCCELIYVSKNCIAHFHQSLSILYFTWHIASSCFYNICLSIPIPEYVKYRWDFMDYFFMTINSESLKENESSNVQGPGFLNLAAKPI